MANVTLSIDDELLVRGRRYADSRGTSLNALLRQLLDETTSKPDAVVDEMVERLRDSTGNSGGEKIVRSDLYRH
ncbi:MAG: hypothetical protein ACI8UO_001390 [Verrucomicrobiales bacterium]|jgi:hypothetical protein